MLSVDEALQAILTAIEPVSGEEWVPLAAALGRVAAENVLAAVDVPPFANSAVDGYAYRRADLGGVHSLPVTQRVAAGMMPAALESGAAARIFTGARVPEGADSVAMQEDCDERDNLVCLPPGQPHGNNIRQAGEDFRQGDVLVAQGTSLRAPHLGLLASAGNPGVVVRRRVRVAVLVTGSELVAPGTPLQGGQIHDSNSILLTALLRESGCDVVSCRTVADTLQETRKALLQASSADFVLTSGGVSVGEEDHVRTVVTELGALDLWKVRMKPGKPLAFGRVGDTPFMGLPGNPAAVLVTFLVFALPALRRRQGRRACESAVWRAPAGFSTKQPGKRREFFRVRLASGDEGRPVLQVHPHQGSGVLSSAAWASGLAVIPENQIIRPGDLLDYLPFAQLME